MVVVVFPSYHAVVGKWETRSAFQVGFIAVFSTPVGGDELSRGAVSKRRMRAVMVVAGRQRERESFRLASARLKKTSVGRYPAGHSIVRKCGLRPSAFYSSMRKYANSLE